MKVTLLVILLTGAFGCSQFHDKRRSPSSVSDCGLTGSVEERIKDCSAQSDSINGIFVLVSRAGLNEVFMDKNTKLIWSDSLAAKMNHPDAEKACRSDLKEMAGISGSWRLPSINEYKTANGIRESLPRMDNWFWSSSIDHENVALAYAFSGDTGEEYIFYPNKKNLSVRCVTTLKSSEGDCGLTGLISDRIKDCSSHSDAVNGNFTLVSRKGLDEVHIDTVSKLLWSGLMSLQTWQWDADKICASKPKEVVGIPGFWRVPSKREFEEAIGNGIKSLPHMDKKLWTSSFASTNTKKELRKAGYRKKASSGAWVYYPTKSLNDSAFLLEDPSYDPAGEFDIFIRCVL